MKTILVTGAAGGLNYVPILGTIVPIIGTYKN